ncbi:MAG: CSN-associated deubiquitinating enzyme Ubp12 [Pycnora praestabilis]|nr:MAG: CSN-associated deubiquitinating enzyme Ubp12 [Pycnora praestabilis]
MLSSMLLTVAILSLRASASILRHRQYNNSYYGDDCDSYYYDDCGDDDNGDSDYGYGDSNYIDGLCFPTNDTGYPDLDAPCNQIELILEQCVYGNVDGDDIDDSTSELGNTQQQTCFCNGGFFDYYEGCNNCERLHGAPIGVGWLPSSYISMQSSSYCSSPATLGFEDFVSVWTISSSIPVGTATGGIDVIGNHTEVSYYFTASSGIGTLTPATAPSVSSTGSSSSTGSASSKASPASTSGTGVLAGPTSKSSSGSATTSPTPTASATATAQKANTNGAGGISSGLGFTDVIAVVTTSSTKKRKLAPSDSDPTYAEKDRLSSTRLPTSASQQSLRVPRHSQPRNNRAGSASTPSPPPRYIPSHLHNDVREASVGGSPRSQTPDYPSTASSPSAACAGLTLETERSGEMSGMGNSGGEEVVEREIEGHAIQNGLNPILEKSNSAEIVTLPDRSYMTTMKRPASELDDGLGKEHKNDVEMHLSPLSDVAREPLSDGASSASTSSTASKPQGDVKDSQHTRSISIDMLAHERRPAGYGTDLSENSEDLHTNPAITSSVPTSLTRENLEAAQDSNRRSPSLPPLDEQVATVTRLSLQQLQEGQQGYAVSNKWLSRVMSRTSDGTRDDKFEKSAREGEIGPLDNSDIVPEGWALSDLKDEVGGSFIPLKPGLQIGEDFEMLPQQAWDLIIKWYTNEERSPIIKRYVHNTASRALLNLQYELYPPIFTVLKLRNPTSGITTQVLKETQASSIKTLASRHDSFNKFLKRVKIMVGIDLQTKVRVWRILGGFNEQNQTGILTPATSRSASPNPDLGFNDVEKKLLLDVHSFLSLQNGAQRELLEQKDEAGNESYNGPLDLSTAGLSRQETIVLEEQIGGPAGGEWISDTAVRSSNANGLPITVTKDGNTNVHKAKSKGIAGSGTSSPMPATSGMMTRGRQRKDGKTRGTTGLSNLGNTCYMNSALQCVRSVEELTRYFLQDKYKSELNPSNPLAHNGEVAKQYALLLHNMYADSGPTSFSPRQFKSTIGRYGPSFSGYGQQDSQEFLGFLLDGLQEDLNRVHKKPYIEKPDSTDEMVNDSAALRKLANRCWDIYKARNDSVIADLFAGTYKSTLVCPVCEKVSITFDPFTNLTLQLPIENSWNRELFYFPLHSRPIRVSLSLDKNGSLRSIKEYIAKQMGTDWQRLVMAEIYKSKFYKGFDDLKSIADAGIQLNDDIGVFEVEELPTNYPPPKKKQQKPKAMFSVWPASDEETEVPAFDSPLADNMLVPIFHRLLKPGSYRAQGRSLFAVPGYITVTRHEANDYDSILRKILASVATMTTKDILRDDTTSDEDSTTQEDSDTVITTEDDGDSSSDIKIKTNSVEGDDGFVDVTMREPNNNSRHDKFSSEVSHSIEQRYLKPRPVLRPGSFIPPQLRNMFEIQYFKASNELVPTGWNNLSEDKEYPTIASRLPPPQPSLRPVPSTSNNHHAMPGDDSSSESDEDIDDVPEFSHNAAQIRDPDADSDSEDLPAMDGIFAQSARNGVAEGGASRVGGKLVTYSRKGKGNFERSHQVTPDHGPLIRLGEGIVLDWTPGSNESLFQGDEKAPDMVRGAATWETINLHPDPELDKRRAIKANQKKRGISLDECLDEFGKEEILSESDAWYCPRCKEHRRASKKFELWKSPDILAIHLKRFSASRGMRDKIDVLVDFPVEGLNLSERVALREDGKDSTYDLFAVDNHYGGLGGGHYTAFAQNFFDKTWYEYNDSHVTTRRNPESVVTANAYLLFYRRRSDTPLGGKYFERIASNDADQQDSEAPRDASPAGDVQLGDSSRNGSSSALTGVGAAHQAGNGLAGEIQARNDDLPTYSSELAMGERRLSHEQTLEGMEVEDEGIDDSSYNNFRPANNFGQSLWSFGRLEAGALNQITAAPPGSDEEEDLFDGASGKVANGSSAGFSEAGDRMADFAEDDGALGGFENTPLRQSLAGTPIQDIPLAYDESDMQVKSLLAKDDEHDAPVAEVHLEEGEGLVKQG